MREYIVDSVRHTKIDMKNYRSAAYQPGGNATGEVTNK